MTRFMYEAVLTPSEDGGFDVEVPDLPGCFSFGATLVEATEMAADAMRTYVASLLAHKEPVPTARWVDPSPNCVPVWVSFEADEDYIVPDERISASEAARILGLSPGRITHMIEDGVLDGYREGRRTWVSRASVDRRLADGARPGRPKRIPEPTF